MKKKCYLCAQNQNRRPMTALAQKITQTPLAPYVGLLMSMSREDKQIVVTFLSESMNELEAESRDDNPSKVSPRIKWQDMHMHNTPIWNPTEEWNKLTDKQRAQAEKMNLQSDDMDERTVAILKKWVP